MKFISPLSVYLPRKTMPDKKMLLNFNVYRNIHHAVNGQLKIEYTRLMEEQLKGVKLKTPIHIGFVLYKSQNRKLDRSNILSIVEKFFCDALTHYGCIEDDNDEYIKSTKYTTGGVDRKNPRVEILIKESTK